MIGSVGAFWTLVALLFVGAIGLLMVGSVFAYCAVVRGRGLGYRPAGLTVGAVAVVVGAAAIPWFVVAQLIDMSAPSPPTDLGPLVVIFLAALATVPAAAAYWAIVKALPARVIRRPGLRARRHHYRAWSHVTAGLTVATVIWSAVEISIEQSVRGAMVGLTLTIGLRWLDRRFAAQVASLPEGLAGHVLYLRAFRTEGRAMFRLPSDRAEFTGQGSRRWVALDEFLVRGAGDRLGRLVALGNPAEFAPPGGATRVYLGDDTWTDELARLADRARAIIIEPGRTESMRWELQYIAEHRLQTRLFILTPPQHRAARLFRRVISMVDRLTGWYPVTWPEFVDELRKARLDLRPEDPGRGAVVTFRDDGTSVVRARGLATPAQYADAILGSDGR